MSHASSSSLKRKRKRNSKKRNIKSRKIDKRERKMLVSKRSITLIMSLHLYACISMNTYCYGIYNISLEIVWWALSNASLIVRICLAVHKILANRDFTVTDDLISQLFVVTFVHSTYMQIAFIWGFLAQLGL